MTDFDFLTGTFDVRNIKLKECLVGCTEWEEFPGVSVARRHFEGAANFDEINFPTKGSTGLTVRLFDPALKQWSLYWASSIDGVLQPPVTGGFVDGRGEFYGDDMHGDTPITVRYVWSGITETSARWEQAFSTDGGETWEANWIMELTRRP